MEPLNLCSRLYPLRILARKWSFLILKRLILPQTFMQIKTELQFITSRSLSLELTFLENNSLLIHKKNIYTLSPSGKELLEALEHLARWSVKYHNSMYCSLRKRCSRCARYPSQIEPRLLKLN